MLCVERGNRRTQVVPQNVNIGSVIIVDLDPGVIAPIRLNTSSAA
jgi:hypothetical protein